MGGTAGDYLAFHKSVSIQKGISKGLLHFEWYYYGCFGSSMSIGEFFESISGSIRGAARCESIYLAEYGDESIVKCSLEAGNIP